MYVLYKFANFRLKKDYGNGILLLENDLSFIQEYPLYIDIKMKINQKE